MRGLARLGRLSARATPVLDPRWLDQAAQTRVRLGIRRPVRLLQSDRRIRVAPVPTATGASTREEMRARSGKGPLQPEPTRLHGLPVDTRMTVTVNFTDES